MKFLAVIITVTGFIIGFLLLLMGVIFKIMHYPDHNLMIFSGLFLIIASLVIKFTTKNLT